MTGAAQDVHPGPARAGPVVCTLDDYPDGITAIDTVYVRPRLDASHLIIAGGRAAFVDTGTTLSVPYLLAALDAKGVSRDAVDWILVTHAHLDHAGGAGALARELANAKVVAHPRAAPHLVDPARLVAATRAVYGAEFFDRLYGEVVPIPAERMVVAEDGHELGLAGRRLRFLHTPGHALHHYVVHDLDARAVFSGDTFGVSYREFDVDGHEFVLPATTPSQFDPEQLTASIDRILALAPSAVYLTHYSRVRDVPRLGEELKAGVREYVAIARRHRDAAERTRRMVADMYAFLSAGLDRHRYPGGGPERHALLDDDITLNVQGLEAWLARRA